MNRRSLLKHLMLISGSLTIMPELSAAKILSAYDELQVTEIQQKLLRKLVDTLIPKTDLKGADELGVHDFVLVMVNDCLKAADQERFMSGLREFEYQTKARHSTYFSEMDHLSAERAIAEIIGTDTGGDKRLEATRYFLKTSKQYAVQGYLNSEYVMTELMPYQLIPGPVFNGKKKIVPEQRVNING
jgi:hypothetical protein